MNDEKYWNDVWKTWRHADKPAWLKAVADRANTTEYLDGLWNRPSRKVEKYSMQWAWWRIKEFGAKSVLDVGCGNGRLLYGVKDTCEVFGIDISPVAIERMKKEYGIDGLAMDIYDMDKLEQKFDFVVINHTLEHLWRDEDVVRLSFNRLNDGGHLYVAVPNNISGPDETDEHVRKYDSNMLTHLLTKIFGNCTIKVIGNHLIGMARRAI